MCYPIDMVNMPSVEPMSKPTTIIRKITEDPKKKDRFNKSTKKKGNENAELITLEFKRGQKTRSEKKYQYKPNLQQEIRFNRHGANEGFYQKIKN